MKSKQVNRGGGREGGLMSCMKDFSLINPALNTCGPAANIFF